MKKPRFPRPEQAERNGGHIAGRPTPEAADRDFDSILNGLPEDEAEEVRLALAQSVSFRGPLPPPALFEHYEQILPGSADRIMTMAEKEQAHRIAWEQAELRTAATQAVGGQIMGFIGLLALVGGAVFCASIGQTEVALAFLGTAVLGVIARFVTNRWSKDGP